MLHHPRMEMMGAHLHHQRYDRGDVEEWMQALEDTNQNLEEDLKKVELAFSNIEPELGEAHCPHFLGHPYKEVKSSDERARDFMRSCTFDSIIVKKTTNEGFLRFYKCLDQLKCLGGLKDSFHPNQVNFLNDSNLQDYPQNSSTIHELEDDEFVQLTDLPPSYKQCGFLFLDELRNSIENLIFIL
ncbi:UNVERIFIED_CONTAM: hypothetical protein Sindi_2414800 [Sesamum indicum]